MTRSGIADLLKELGFEEPKGVVTLKDMAPDRKRDYSVRSWAREAAQRVCRALDFDDRMKHTEQL